MTAVIALLGAAAVAACDADAPPAAYPLPGPTAVYYGVADHDATADDDAPSTEAACKAGDASACHRFGARVCREGSVLECRAACDAGNGAACDRLADIYERGVRVTTDAARAARLRQRACDDGLDSACARCADTDACAADAAQLARDLDRACRRCPFRRVGAMTEDESAECRACDALAESDPKSASADLQRACTVSRIAADASGRARDYTSYGACSHLADIDPGRAAAVFEGACGRGIVDACAYVAAPKHARSERALVQALTLLCERDPHSDACGRLKDLGASVPGP